MKKVDLILKKAELFERLSVYGDRKSFLAALAQDNASYEDLNYTPEGINYTPATEFEMELGEPKVVNVTEVANSKGDPRVAKYYMLANNAKNLVDRIGTMHETVDLKQLALLHGKFDAVMAQVNDAIKYLGTINSNEAKTLLNRLQLIKNKADLPDMKDKTQKALLANQQKDSPDKQYPGMAGAGIV